MGTALLLSSAGLAAGLLASSAMGANGQLAIAWQSPTVFTQAANQLNAAPRSAAQALPVSLSSMVPTYSAAGSPVYRTAFAGPATARLAEPAAIPKQASPPTVSAFKTTVQRSWDTFKLAFQ